MNIGMMVRFSRFPCTWMGEFGTLMKAMDDFWGRKMGLENWICMIERLKGCGSRYDDSGHVGCNRWPLFTASWVWFIILLGW